MSKFNGFVINRHATRTVIPFSSEAVASNAYGTILPNELLSIDEIVEDLFHWFPRSKDLTKFKKTSKANLTMYHHSLGQFIRNTYGLWLVGNPNVIPDDLGDGHPDGVSMIVLKKFHDKLNGSDAYDDAMGVI
jgi:hypothetical protein